MLTLLLAIMMPSEAKKKKTTTPKLSTIEMIEKVNNHWQATHSPEERAFWDNAAYYTGNMEAYKLLGHAKWLEYSDKWCRHNDWKGAKEKDPKKWKYKNYGEGQDYVLFGDWQICFQTYIDMYMMNPDPYKIARAKEVMDYECAQPQNDFWWWADALYMVMPVMTKLYKATGDTKYLDKLYDNFSYADNLMHDEETGLYFRDGKYIYPKHKTDLGKKDFWARGDGWVLAGLAKVLADMPVDYKHRPFFLKRYQQLAAGVIKCQQKEGYWTRSMLDPEQAEGPETSGTAFFCYGLLWGINHQLLDRATYEPAMQRAWKYLTEKALQPDGSIGYVQPIGEKAIKGQQLGPNNTANFGTGAFLLAACEKVRFDEGSVVAEKAGVASSAPSMKVELRNPLKVYRQQVVEIDAKKVFEKLGISGGRQFQVINARGMEVPYQLTYDGKLLIDASMMPEGTSRFTIRKGQPSVFPNVCYGRLYPERIDDMTWENDLCAYRAYGPELQRRGEHSFGIDIWVKNTPDLVVEQRYYTEKMTKPAILDLRKSNRAKADSLESTVSYHIDHGRGLDPYKVGATLGCGTPALIDGDKMKMPWSFKDYEILDNGPLRFTVALNYNKVEYRGDSITEHRIISLDKGSNFNRMQVWYDGLSKSADVCSGVVIHSEDTASVQVGSDYVQYADPSDNPGNECQVFVGCLYPEGKVETKALRLEKPNRDNWGHAIGIKRGITAGERFDYWFGAAWSRYDVRNHIEWRQRGSAFCDAVRTPVEVKYQ